MDLRNIKINTNYSIIHKKIILLAVLIIITSCSTFKNNREKTIYTDTSGLSLKYEFNTEDYGYLFISGVQDSIFFKYNLKKTKQTVIDAKKKKEKKVVIYEYNIEYLGDKHQKYKVLDNFKKLTSLKKMTTLIYKPHN
jgi:hypothetical protein